MAAEHYMDTPEFVQYWKDALASTLKAQQAHAKALKPLVINKIPAITAKGEETVIDIGTFPPGAAITPQGINQMLIEKVIRLEKQVKIAEEQAMRMGEAYTAAKADVAKLKDAVRDVAAKRAWAEERLEATTFALRAAEEKNERNGPPRITNEQWKRISRYG